MHNSVSLPTQTLFSHVHRDDRADLVLASAVAGLSALTAPFLYWVSALIIWS